VATVKAVEQRISNLEGFDVVILHQDGRDVRGDRERLPQYGYERAMKNSSNVKEWKRSRFQNVYPGFEVVVLDATGQTVHGRTLLGTVRDTYLDA
jgi:hypothetical protein